MGLNTPKWSEKARPISTLSVNAPWRQQPTPNIVSNYFANEDELRISIAHAGAPLSSKIRNNQCGLIRSNALERSMNSARVGPGLSRAACIVCTAFRGSLNSFKTCRMQERRYMSGKYRCCREPSTGRSNVEGIPRGRTKSALGPRFGLWYPCATAHWRRQNSCDQVCVRPWC